ncbi:MAG TPA: AAA family ATPase, partial [Verrucomicrobiales bacterium]|nr:AAA family ATPase [Verrucomicrobiales bacterium]
KGEPVQRLFTGAQLQAFQQLVKKVPVAEDVARYAVRLAAASRPKRPGAPDFVNEWVSWGAGTRASQNLVLGGKTRALIQGRAHVTFDDIRALAQPVLRHRILVNYRAEAEGVTVEKVIARLLETVKQ